MHGAERAPRWQQQVIARATGRPAYVLLATARHAWKLVIDDAGKHIPIARTDSAARALRWAELLHNRNLSALKRAARRAA